MQRNSVMRVLNVLRYNSPSKRQIRRLAGRPKSLNASPAEVAPVAVEPPRYAKKEDAPFAVTRTAPGKNLPVYSDFRNNGSRRLTIIRRIEGDINEMAAEVERVCPESSVEIHQGSIHVKGDYNFQLKKWLADMGF